MKSVLVRISLLVFAFLGLLAAPAHAAGPSDLRIITLQSAALGRATSVDVLLPDDYATSGKHYPVLYLLHGYGQSASDWSRRTGWLAISRSLW